MTFKYIVLLTIGVLRVHAAELSVAPAAPVLAKLEDFDAVPRYSYAYDVQDALTGDSKAQFETRNGDVVQGSYSLIEADGTRRIVDYTADPINGFNAVVNREPAIAVAPVVARTAVAAAAPVVARNVVAAAAPVVAARNVVPASPVVAPVVARAAVAAAPLAYTLPRAVATRLAPPTFAAPFAYAAAPAFL